ncbi:unnamed protein product, partial [Brassica oleracea]
DYDDTAEGKKVCTYYKLESIPVVLVIDPTTETTKRQLLIDSSFQTQRLVLELVHNFKRHE